MSFVGSLRVEDLQRLVTAAQARQEGTVRVEMNDPSEDDPPVAVRLSAGEIHAAAKFDA